MVFIIDLNVYHNNGIGTEKSLVSNRLVCLLSHENAWEKDTFFI